MAVYNGRPYIAEQIGSILDQSHRDLQITIRDNTSTDGTPAIVRDLEARHPSQVRLLPGDGYNVGALGNFARLLDQAQPGYVMFSDADDVWLPDKVALTLAKMRELEARHGADAPILIHTDARVVDRNLAVIADSFRRYQFNDPQHGAALNRLLVQNVATGCTMMLNASLVKLARPVPVGSPGVPGAIMHDWWIALAAAAAGAIGYVPQATLLYRQHGGNDTGAKAWGPRRMMRAAWSLSRDDSMRVALRRTQDQAAALLQHLQGRLPEPQRRLIAAYASLPQRSYLGRRRLMFRHGFFKTGLTRNLGMLAAL